MQSPISTGRLLSDTFSTVNSIYGPLLVFSTPTLIVGIINQLHGLNIPINLINFFVILPWFTGAEFFYVHQSLTHNITSVSEALQYTSGKIFQLVLANIFLVIIIITSLLVLIVPGIYVAVLLSFTYHEIVIESCEAVEGISNSWNLVKNRWWSVLWANVVISLVIIFPVALISIFFAITFGAESTNLLGPILIFLTSPLFSVYTVVLYMALQTNQFEQ